MAEIIFGGIAFSVPERGLLDLIFHNLMLVPVGFVLILLMNKIEINNLILKTMNRYTMFIYLFQFPVLMILKNYYQTKERPFDVFFFLACLGFTYILAVIIQIIYDRVGMMVNKCFHSND